ncbi:hypothetical protein SAMN05444920_107403 [Nonomuraea solani]|uniref:Uncharacterized protein n=1 Tax=Nonomuraea solani TaxID=1144553 RepID=A0A1H6E4N0_9ACTN|nr:hypothetical protein SAMN05444920_107403 [Nonomuraea solani]
MGGSGRRRLRWPAVLLWALIWLLHLHDFLVTF